MPVLLPITSERVDIYKAVRLRALQDTPSAFGSTYEKESHFPDATWIERAKRCEGSDCTGYLAMDGATACGLAIGFLDEHDPKRSHLVSMWFAPTHRYCGTGRLLVNGILDWARQQHVATLRLTVTSNNDAAIQFYARLGFEMTGRTMPYPNDSALFEREMFCALR